MHAEEQKSHGKQWLLGIGIGKYIELPNLANAVKDVKDIIKVLTEDYGVSPSTTVTLFDEDANQENVIHKLDQLAGKVGNDDNLIIYFAGHGYLNKTTDMGYWIPHDAKKGRTSRYIGNSTIRDYLKAIKSKHTLLIVDSCFSGSFFVRGASRSNVALQELESIPSRWAICSGRSDEEVSDGIRGENSPFAQSILDALRDNTNKLLNVAKVADRVVEQTRSNFEQLPEGNPIQGVGHKGGQYIFHRKAREEKFWEECQRKNTVRYYSQYLSQFPDGKYRSVALARMRELEDEDAWREAETSGTISALHIYVGRNPAGKYIKEAKEKISILEKRETNFAVDERPVIDKSSLTHVEQTVEEDDINSLRQNVVSDSSKEIEEELWKVWQKTSDYSDLRRYLAYFPSGKYAQEARSVYTPPTSGFVPSGPMTYSQAPVYVRPARKQEVEEDEKKESKESSLEAYQKEVNSRLFVETKKESLFSLKISIIVYVFVGFILYLYASKALSEGMVWTIVILGYMLYQIEGILFSIRSYHNGFKGGTHAGYLLPIFTFFAWLVGTFFIEDYSKGFLPFASLGPMIVSILGRRYIVIAAQKKWVSAEDL